MNLEENLTMTFTGKFQPSKIARKGAATVAASTSTVDVSSIGVGRGRGRGGSRVIAGRAVPPLIYDHVKSTIQTVKKKKKTLGHVTYALTWSGALHGLTKAKMHILFSSYSKDEAA